MSCLDVMYPAYGHYAPYAPSAPAFINSLQAPTAVTPSHCRDRMDTSRGPDGLPGGPGNSSSSSTSSSSTASSLSSPASSYITAGTRSEEGPKDKSAGAPEAEYLSSRCVLFTYYQGDISSVVDQHFSRALSSYMDGEGKRRAPETHGTDAASPSGRRSFPPSFWDSNYPSPQSRPHCDPHLLVLCGPVCLRTAPGPVPPARPPACPPASPRELGLHSASVRTPEIPARTLLSIGPGATLRAPADACREAATPARHARPLRGQQTGAVEHLAQPPAHGGGGTEPDPQHGHRPATAQES
ncbi:hypothetical protein NQD34_015964 [Periophthalmus magnuspinnatus]|nr:hypothetical protein NQD34_015964 [Periophthalmus magnuspinnatus]